MSERPARVVSVNYDEFVEEFIVDEHDTPLATVVHKLEGLGVETRGEYRIYWPADTYVVYDGISQRAAEILKRVFTDPRVVISPMPAIEYRSFEVDLPRRDGHRGTAHFDGGRLKRYRQDHLLRVMVNAAPDAYESRPEFTPIDQPIDVQFVYVDETLSERHEMAREQFERCHTDA